jgi:chromosome segregation ATPase
MGVSMPNDNEDKKKEAEELQNKIIFLAGQQIELSKSLEALRPEIDALEGKKKALLADLELISNRIAEKESQRNEELNRRDELLQERESAQNSEALRLVELDKKLSAKDNDLKVQYNNLADALNKNLEITQALNGRESLLNILSKRVSDERKRLEDKEVLLQEILEDLNKEREALGKREADLVLQINNFKESDKDLQSRIELAQKKEEVLLEGLNKLAADRQSLSEESQKVAERLALADQRDKEYKGQLDIIDQERKKLELGWLQINKKNQDKQLGMDIEAMKK